MFAFQINTKSTCAYDDIKRARYRNKKTAPRAAPNTRCPPPHCAYTADTVPSHISSDRRLRLGRCLRGCAASSSSSTSRDADPVSAVFHAFYWSTRRAGSALASPSAWGDVWRVECVETRARGEAKRRTRHQNQQHLFSTHTKNTHHTRTRKHTHTLMEHRTGAPLRVHFGPQAIVYSNMG